MAIIQDDRKCFKEKIPFRIKIAYGSGDMVAGLAFNSINFLYFFFLNIVVGLPPYLAGLVLLTGHIWNGFADLIMGMIVDSTTAKQGKHRVWILISIVPFVLAFFLLWVRFPGTDTFHFTIYTLLFTLFSTTFSMYSIPFGSMTADLTHDYHERTAITGVRMVFSLFTMIVGAGITQLLAGIKFLGYSGMAAIFSVVMCAAGLTAYAATKERDTVVPKSEGIKLHILLQAFQNRPFVLLVSSYLLLTVATTGVSSIFIYFIRYGLRLTNNLGSSLIMSVLVLSAIAALPLWASVSKKISKKSTLFSGMAIFGAGLVAITFIGLSRGPVLFYMLDIVTGIGLSSFFIVLWSMIPDVVEYGQLQTGYRHEGVYYGVWFFMQKLGMALSATINGFVLTDTGFKQEQGGRLIEQAAASLEGINLLMAGLPVTFIAVGLALLAFYPIDAVKHAQIRDELDKKRVPVTVR